MCRLPRSVPPLLLLLTLLPAAAALAAEETPEELAAYIRANYTKLEVRIPMRDGVRLFTVVYAPNDTSTTYPFLLHRTPYGVDPYGADRYKDRLGPHGDFVHEGFIFVYQDVRGRYLSEGEFVNMRPHIEGKSGPGQFDESSDTWDTIDWLLRHVPNHNGKVGMWGISYPGFYSSAGMIDSHPALVAVSPQAPIADWFWDDMHHHGAFILPLAFDFFSSFGQARPEPTTTRPKRFDHGTRDGYRFFLDLGPLGNANERYFHGEIAFWNDLVAHPNYDPFWQARNLLPHLRNIKAAVLTVGGWFDTEDLYGPLHTYRAVEDHNPGIFNVLVMGPWSHGGWVRTDGDVLGSADFGFKTSKYYQQRVDLPFFRHFLKGAEKLDLPEALVFETGANRWRAFDAWPPPGRREVEVFLAAGGGLAFSPPAAAEEAFDAYTSDPAKPVPYTLEITTAWAKNYMTEDQRFAAWRPDVLVYQTDPLADDLTLAGPVVADLWVSTSGTDSDWVVKVIDVFPDRPASGEAEGEEKVSDQAGYQMLVRGEVFRGRFRASYEHPEPFVPDQPTHLAFPLQDVLHTFQRGHRLMVQVQSTWFPFVDRNPGTFVPNIFTAEPRDFITVTNRVFRSAAHASRLRVGVLDPPASQAP